MIDLSNTQKFSPWTESRNSEFANWGLAAIFLLAIFFIPIQFSLARKIIWVLLPIFILVASMTSFSNLMDRHTLLTLDVDSIEFSSLLRKVKFNWKDVERVQVIPLAWSEKIFIIGKNEKFSFMTESKVEINNEIKGKSGFENGDQILIAILDITGLSSSNKIDQNASYYYQKE